MNKKFSTLLAGAALLSAVSANAGNPVKTVSTTGLYQLKVETNATGTASTSTDNVLTMDKNGKLLPLTYTQIATNPDTLAYSLWCVEVTAEGYGKAPVYNFTNKATGQRLDVAYAGTVLNGAAKPAAGAITLSGVQAEVGGEMQDWAFSATYQNSMNAATLYSYFHSDSVVGLKLDGGRFELGKATATTAQADAQKGDVFTKFTLVEPDSIVMNANAVNTIFGTQEAAKGVKLTFVNDKNNTTLKNYFTDDAKFFAVDAEDNGTADSPWLRIITGKKADATYVYVDTAYVNENGTRFLGFATKQFTAAKLKGKTIADTLGTVLNDQSKFRFVYFPAKDSLVIQVKQTTYTKDGKNGNFKKSLTSASDYDRIVLGDNGVVNELALNYNAGITGKIDKDQYGKANYVTVQDLVKADQIRITTIYFKKEVEIALNYKGCGTYTTDKTSIADGVYLIKNNKTGKYLAVPIYNDTTWLNNVEDRNKAEWVSLDLQDATHMPAYQWVVLKDNATDKNNVSPITATNREYASVITNAQLNKKAGAAYYYSSAFAGADSLEFVPVAKEIYSDKYLGYKKINKDSLIVTNWTFNYYHPYAADKYIAVKDTTMTVLEGVTAFKINSTDAEHKYGFYTAAAAKRIQGLAQLVRTKYQMQIINGKDTAIFGNYNEAVENKYTVSKYNAKTDSVYFKANNCIERTEGAAKSHYYAILEADADNTIRNYKAGVSDYDATASLRAQSLRETRTSAFYITNDETPLYRRFNNAAVGENADDSIDSLYFVESIRQEYLMDEWNKNLTTETVDYAGIWAKDVAKGHLAFRIDSAWLNRGLGNIKPQYLISTNSALVEGEKIIPCTYEHNHYDNAGNKVDAAHCSHAEHVKTPAFIYGKYLVNFSDSVKTNKAALNPYLFNTAAVSNSSYTRVGFVPAIKYADTLIVLTGKYKAMTIEQLKNTGVESILADTRKNYPTFVNVLSGDNHKNVTWSFRYVSPEKSMIAYADGQEGVNNQFLFESNVYGTGDTKYQTYGVGELARAIAPKTAAAWLKMHNGCLVLTEQESTFDAAKTGGDGALVFNAYQKTAAEDMVTSNDEVSVEGVSVIAGNGTVTVQGAAGKSVVISNILGKVVAETVLSSDNATIAVPAGIVAVAVEGEDAVKTIVK
ncbi:MAG: DUF6383 domain-containing protein [Parabacteroides sp.]|nr:DUF6383 domain-containing protein [Parabacteroides sp.]